MYILLIRKICYRIQVINKNLLNKEFNKFHYYSHEIKKEYELEIN